MAETQQHDRQVDRPLTVTLVILGVFALGLANIWRALATISQRSLLKELGASPDPLLQAMVAIFWALILLWMVAKLWRRWAPTRYLLPILLLVYAGYQLAVLQIFSQSGGSVDDWVTAAVVYGSLSLLIIWALNRKAARKYFRIS